MLKVKVAADFMRRELVTLAPQTDVCEAVSRLLRHNISGAPVVDSDGSYLGVFSEKCSINAMTRPVAAARELPIHMPVVREFMVTELIAIKPHIDVFEAIDHLLARRISGAPVIDDSRRFLGVFSEKTAMRALVAAIHDQLPGTRVDAYMNTDLNRLIHDDDSLIDIAHKFQRTPYRRLPILYGEKLGGQVSRRDVLWAEHRLIQEVASRVRHAAADEPLRALLQPCQVEGEMDTDAQTIKPETDLLSIAQIFLNTPYRRLPVLADGRLVGQVSRRDVLETAAAFLRPAPPKLGPETLYLSPLVETPPPSLQ